MLTESANVKRILTSEATKLVQVAEAEDKAKESTQQKSPAHTARPSYTTKKLFNYGMTLLLLELFATNINLKF